MPWGGRSTWRVWSLKHYKLNVMREEWQLFESLSVHLPTYRAYLVLLENFYISPKFFFSLVKNYWNFDMGWNFEKISPKCKAGCFPSHKERKKGLLVGHENFFFCWKTSSCQKLHTPVLKQRTGIGSKKCPTLIYTWYRDWYSSNTRLVL